MKQVKDRNVEFPNRFELINTANGMSVGIFDLKDIPGAITEQGTPIDAELFDSIDDDILLCTAVIELDGTNLILKNKDGDKIGTVDLSKLTFDIELKNYYTKTETDTITGEISAEIAAETARATGVEANIASDLSGEIDRAEGVETTISEDLASEVTRATGAEAAISAELTSEIARAKGAEETNATAISAETTRAKTVEGNISSEVDTLRGNLTATETALDGKITTEKDRATTAENALSESIAAETTRAQTAEKANADSISAEVTRATNAENALSERVTTAQETADTAESIARGRSQARVFDTIADLTTWLSSNENVATLNIGDNLYIKEIDVPDYWWDGAAAQELETEKPDLTPYATKTALESERERATGAETTNATNIANEITRAKTAEEANATAIADEVDRATKAESALTTKNTEQDTAIQTAQNTADGAKTAADNAASAASTAQSTADSKYSKPTGGIPKTDLASGVQTSLDKADTALQSFTETDPTVPAWAKTPQKPTYTAAEISGLERVILDFMYPVGGNDRYIQFPDMPAPEYRWVGTKWEIDEKYAGRTPISYGVSNNPLYRGEFSSNTQYYQNEIVSYLGRYYLAREDNYGADPENIVYWTPYHNGATGGSPDAVVVSHAHDRINYYGNLSFSLGDATGLGGTQSDSTSTEITSVTTHYEAKALSHYVTSFAGESGVGKNMMPYTVVTFWKRIA